MTNQTISQKLNYLILTLTLWLTAGTGMAQTYSLGSDNAEVEWTVEPVERTPGVEAVRGVVPGTVFGAYVQAGREKDPNWGDNIQQVDRQGLPRHRRDVQREVNGLEGQPRQPLHLHFGRGGRHGLV